MSGVLSQSRLFSGHGQKPLAGAFGKGRLYVLFSFVFFMIAAILGQLVWLTYPKGAGHDVQTSYQGALITRKNIVDRNGALLATNLMMGSVYANPQEVIDVPKAVKKLLTVFPTLDKKELTQKLASQKKFVWIKRNITPQEQQRLLELGLPGVYDQRSEKRVYIHGAQTSHLLGMSSIDMQGTSGVERFFDKELTGTGEPLQLSIDMRIQSIVHEELKKGIEKFQALGGTAVMMDVQTGEVLSMVSFPDFDPNELLPGDTSALFNMATQGVYELGSVFKVFIVGAALESGKVALTDGFDATKPVKIGKFTVRDYRGKNRWLSVPEIVMYSSNIGVIKMLQEIGKDTLREFYEKIGLFEPLVGFEFGEVASPVLGGGWSEARAMTSSYGYGVSTTPLHFARSMAAMVNDGVMVNPSLVKGNPSKIEQRVLSKKTSDDIKKLLYLSAQKGTGRRARVDGYMVGGKTGSANKSMNGTYDKKNHLATVSAIFPMNKPKYILVVTLDSPKGTKETFGFSTGGWTAAPIASEVIKRAGPLLKVLPVDEKSDVIRKAMYVKVDYDGQKRAIG